jgi:hypothetical protein
MTFRRSSRSVHVAIAAAAVGALVLAAGASGARWTGAAAPAAADAGYPARGNQLTTVMRFLIKEDQIPIAHQLGIDVNEGTTKNPDGTIWITTDVTPAQREYLAALGFQPGQVIATPQDWLDRLAERSEAVAAEQAARKAAKTGRPARIAKRGGSLKALLVTDSLKVTRADFFQSYSGTWLSVEAKTNAAAGSSPPAPFPGSQSGSCVGVPANGAISTACPILNVAYTVDGTTYANGAQTQMQSYVDDGVYLYHRLLIRLSNFAGNATAPHPTRVRVASNAGGLATRAVTEFADTPPVPPGGFQQGFLTHYMTPEDDMAFIQQLAAERPDIAHVIDLPNLTNGYRRYSQASIGCNANQTTACTTAQQPTAVLFQSKEYDDNAISVQTVNPGVANSPLSVSVAGTAITINLATDGAGALASTAAQVVAAVNADPAASALVGARTYRLNTGAGITPAAGPFNLRDSLNAPAATVPRAPFQNKLLRICKVCDGSKTGFFVFSEEHAREWVAPLVSLETAARLVRNYGTDPETTAFVDNLDIFVMPVENPDGANYSFFDSNSQRRNMTNHCGIASNDQYNRNSWGVDTNRNFSVGSLFDGYEGASTSCTNDVFAGPFELSEPEVRNEVWVLDTFANIRFSMNIHTSGGYFMWSPASYKTQGRVALPYASYGWERTFWSTARKVITRIKGYRGTVVTPARTGPVVDVLYSAAGNSSDEYWYNHNIIAYDFECGADLYSTTSLTSNTGGGVGFQPNFANEGVHEGMEFANGMYGLMSAAVDFAKDTSAPGVTSTTPSGSIGESSISTTLDEDEPADIYFTTDGSTPTTGGSTAYDFSGFREQEGETLTFTQTTTLKWIGVDPKGNTSEVRSATFYVIPPGTPSYASPPQAIGDQKVAPGATLAVGYDFTIPGKHPATDVLFVGGQVTFQATCAKGPGGGTIRVPLPDQAYSVAQDEKGWFPTKDKNSDDVFQGSTTIPDLCAGGLVRLGEGTFSSRILATTTPVNLTVRWHYDADAHQGGWSDTFSVSPDQSN